MQEPRKREVIMALNNSKKSEEFGAQTIFSEIESVSSGKEKNSTR